MSAKRKAYFSVVPAGSRLGESLKVFHRLKTWMKLKIHHQVLQNLQKALKVFLNTGCLHNRLLLFV